MAVVGIDYDAAQAKCTMLEHDIDEFRAQLNSIGTSLSQLTHADYISATMDAFQAKFDTESRPQMEKIIARAQSAVDGTRKVIEAQRARQETEGAAVNRI